MADKSAAAKRQRSSAVRLRQQSDEEREYVTMMMFIKCDAARSARRARY